jgi:hypothetical protein
MKKIVLFKNITGKFFIVLRDKHKVVNLYGIFDVYQKKLLLNKQLLFKDLTKGIYLSSTVISVLQKYLVKQI